MYIHTYIQRHKQGEKEMGDLTHTAASSVTTTRTVLTEELQKRFIEYIDARPQSLIAYGKGLKCMFSYFMTAGITSPRREDMMHYRDQLKAKYAPTTTALYLTAARLFFKWTAQEGLYPNIAEHVKGATLDRAHRKGYFTSAAIKNIIGTADRDTATGKRDYAILALMTTGGLRCIEVTRANIEDLTIQGDSTILFVQGKGKYERTDYVKIPEKTEKAIRDYLATRGEVKPSDPLFVCRGNRNAQGRLTTRSISRICKDHFKAAGYNDRRLTAHSLRHTAATLAILAGATLIEAQEHLRHASPETTMIYINETNRAANSSAAKIADTIF